MLRQVGIVVLNYKNYKETEKCINSALKQEAVVVSIIVVDNGSKNESVEVLHKKYNSNGKVTIFALPQNLGYARGNNIGINCLRMKGINLICVANSDIVFTSNRILAQMTSAYKKGVGIVLPTIKNTDGTLDSYVSYKGKYLLLRMLKAIVVRQPIFIKQSNSGSVFKSEALLKKLEPGILENSYAVTGSFFMLTPDYFANYTQLFPETFLYFEEWATILLLYKADLKCAVVDSDIVTHIGGLSTPASVKGDLIRKKKIIAASSRKVLKLIFMSQKAIAKKYKNLTHV